jgi:Flp pilus assembly protein TadD
MFDKGISELREATRIRPDDAEAHSYLGLAYFEKGDLDKFTTELQEAVRIQPRDFLAHFGLGMNYYVEGDFSQANTEFQEAMRINPELSRIVDGFNPMIRAFRDFYESFTGS